MPAIASPDITNLDFSVLFDVSMVPPQVVLTNQSTVVNAAALDWWFVITTPSGSAIHMGSGVTPDIDNAPFTTQTYNTWPQPMGQIEWGAPYTVTVYVRDSTGAEFSLTKTTSIIRPVGNHPKSKNNFGTANVIADMRCDRAQLYVEDTTSYTWNGQPVTSFPERTWILVYPLDATDTQPPDFVLQNSNNALIPVGYSGPGYQIVRRVVAEYDQGDGVKIRIKYKYTKDFEVQCDMDLCPLTCEYEKMLAATEGGKCDMDTCNTLVTINGLINLALIAKTQPLCGINVASIIDQIKALGNFECDCGGGSNTGGGGVNGGGSGGSGGNLSMTVTATGGDLKVGLLTVTGNNIVLEMSDTSYQFTVDQSVPNSLAQAMSFAVATSANGYVRSVTLKMDEAMAQAWFNNGFNTAFGPAFSAAFTPAFNAAFTPAFNAAAAGLSGAPTPVNIVSRGTSNPPVGCPGSPYPLQLWSTDGLTQGAIVSSISELVAALTADPGWSALGMWAAASNCQALVWKANGVTTVPNIQTTDLSYTTTCVNNKRDYIYKLDALACQANMKLKSYPYDLRLSYTSGGSSYYISGITSYSDLITKLNAQPNKPAHITFEAIGTKEDWVLVRDTDCSMNTLLSLLPSLSRELFYAVAMGDVPTTLGGSYLIDSNGPSELAIVCGSPQSNQRCLHSVKVGNLIYYVDSTNGAMHRVDVSDPLNPVHSITGLLPGTSGGHTAFGGSGPALYDVFFQTDLRTDGSGFLYIVESSSGFIWKYSIVSDTVVGYDWNQLIVGRVPRCIMQGTLWLTLDGTRGTTLGATLTNTDRLHTVTLSSLTMTAGSSVVNVAAGPLIAGEELWSASWDGARRCVWVTTQNVAGTSTSLVRCDEAGNVANTYLNAWMIPAGVMSNTHIFGDRIYLSEKSNGTRYLELANPFVAPVPFQPAVLGGNTYNTHWNFLVPNGACYGILTFDRGTGAGTRGGFAKYSLDGKLISIKAGTIFGNSFNVIPIYDTIFGKPNGLC